ncbi:hypothetical protein AAMO2058_001022800 [Amorphochlora amoebiformis]
MKKSLRTVKKELRKAIRASLRNMAVKSLREESGKVAQNLFESKAYRESRALCLFISMPTGEIDTSLMLSKAFKDGKRCFIPRCISKTEMVMLEAKSLEDIKSFEKNHWEIPEPGINEGRMSAFECKELDLVVVPGIAFDKNYNRCGQGAGYYDRFFTKLKSIREKGGSSMPSLIGVGLKCQLVEEVPCDENDFALDNVISS